MRKSLVIICISVIAFMSLVACKKNDDVLEKKDSFALSHFDGSDISNGYDTDLVYRNQSNLWCGDTGVIYVDEKKDPVYGGYFYQYASGNAAINPQYSVYTAEDGKQYREQILITRSKDLNDWEVCGAVDGGMGLQIGIDDWVWNFCWAPEVIQDPDSGKYFMYFSAQVREKTKELEDKGARYQNYFNADGSHSWLSELNLGIAVSETPVGPFKLVSSENVYGDRKAKNPYGEIITSINPPIMFYERFNLENEFSAIDLHPFFDDNGDFYLYFVKHISVASQATNDPRYMGNQMWGIKMKDMITPDYDTITKLVAKYKYGTSEDYMTVSYKGETQMANDPNYPRNLDGSYNYDMKFPDGTDSDFSINDGTVVEAPQILKTVDRDGKRVYLATYANRGVGSHNYDTVFAYSYSPLGPFSKPKEAEGRTIIGYDSNVNDFMSNLGHVQFLIIGDETWMVHWEVPVSIDVNEGRIYALAPVSWQWETVAREEGKTMEFLAPIANGPTKTVQPLPAFVSGYRNVVKDATITTSKGTGAEYLSDGLVTMTELLSEKEFVNRNKDVEITLKFTAPQTIRGIAIYNSYDYYKAFLSIDSIEFKLAETPACYKNGEANSCYIKDLGIDPWTINRDTISMRPGGAALATFAEIKVTEIIIKISQPVSNQAKEIAVSDIYVFGK